MALTSKQAKFVASYQINHNSTESAKNAGYPDKSAPSIGCQLLRNPKIIAELEAWKTKKASQYTKEDFIDKAMDDYKALELTEPNKPRFMDIAGKALGYLNNNGDQRPNQTLNITINADDLNNKQIDIWENTRKLLGFG